MRIHSKSKKALQQGGLELLLKRMLRKIYLPLRRFMPHRNFTRYNGVKVRSNKLFEEILDLSREDKKNFEQRNLEAISQHAKKDEEIIIIGGGYGVTAKRAHDIVKDGNGSVTAIEASKSQIEELNKIKDWNNIEMKTIHGIVGEENSVYGELGNPKKLDINDLDADIIQMDVEGSECSILENMQNCPNKIIIETHGVLGCSTSEVKSKLKELGYSVEDLGPERDEERFKEKDVHVLAGIRKNK